MSPSGLSLVRKAYVMKGEMLRQERSKRAFRSGKNPPPCPTRHVHVSQRVHVEVLTSIGDPSVEDEGVHPLSVRGDPNDEGVFFRGEGILDKVGVAGQVGVSEIVHLDVEGHVSVLGAQVSEVDQNGVDHQLASRIVIA